MSIFSVNSCRLLSGAIPFRTFAFKLMKLNFRSNFFLYLLNSRRQWSLVRRITGQHSEPVSAPTEENNMHNQLRAGAIALALLGSIGLAAAQNPPGSQQEKLNLSPSQGQTVSEGLSREPTQSAQEYQGQVGSKPPESLKQQNLPNDVTAQVPATRNMLFIKLPDRILLIDPDNKMVTEIVGGPATTGANPGPDGK
jgi:hypothetical protein